MFAWTDAKNSFKRHKCIHACSRANITGLAIHDCAAMYGFKRKKKWKRKTPSQVWLASNNPRGKSCSCVYPKHDWLFWQVHLFPAVSHRGSAASLMHNKTLASRFMFQFLNTSSILMLLGFFFLTHTHTPTCPFAVTVPLMERQYCFLFPHQPKQML